MWILSLNVAKPRIVQYKGMDVATGIYKTSVEGPRKVSTLRIEGDEQADLRSHGGVDKAVYAFAHENYSFYEKFLGVKNFGFGQFGENLTTEGMLENEVRIGDRYRINDVLLEVSQPRSPCFKLGIKMGTPNALKACITSGKTGFYLRVLREGEIQSGDAVEVEFNNASAPSVAQVHSLYYLDRNNVCGMRIASRCEALSAVWRNEFTNRLRGSSQ